MYERRDEPVISRRQFAVRMARHMALVFLVLAAMLFLGMLGYHSLEGLPWLDALLNASMILGGMGPVNQIQTDGGKLFASFYALFSGVVFIGLIGVILTPMIHRVLHAFHVEDEDGPA